MSTADSSSDAPSVPPGHHIWAREPEGMYHGSILDAPHSVEVDSASEPTMTATAPGSDFDSSNPFGAGNGPSPMRTTEDVDSSYEGSVRSSRRGPPSSGGDSIETLEGWENDSPGTRTPTAASRTHGHEQGQTSGDVSPRTLPASTAGGDAPPVSASEYWPTTTYPTLNRNGIEVGSYAVDNEGRSDITVHLWQGVRPHASSPGFQADTPHWGTSRLYLRAPSVATSRDRQDWADQIQLVNQRTGRILESGDYQRRVRNISWDDAEHDRIQSEILHALRYVYETESNRRSNRAT
ncbi:hypothetical protein I316_02493 [Kwoniella heveanensis BCC8398]|uniref:Uncharacterized protein n=1 Tax=Kwoniella heveanensis BCC8398 TaxID=1296120 RepID=A0A1B9GY74_9TREE|nr:hypothetical protein I316_02493 [Kwoniella heveanensis BCC8398]